VTCNLVEAHSQYLTSQKDERNVHALIAALDEQGYLDEARLLEQYHFSSGTLAILRAAPWNGGECILSSQPPKIGPESQFWFDPVECAIMKSSIALPDSSTDATTWVSIRPVRRWQFASFLQSAEIEQRRYNSLRMFDSSRFGSEEICLPQTNIFALEAWSYAVWYGKWLTSIGQWEALCASIDDCQLDEIFPKSLRFWQLDDFREEFGVAYGRETLTDDAVEQADELEDGRVISREKRIVYWLNETGPDFGLSTSVLSNFGLEGKISFPGDYRVRNMAIRSGRS
jgi:hypothetical protein